ncbi:MAG: heavy metal translocating P-type ATPase metal-binding domain-containing protein, partial [Thiobacillus sp.]
MSHSSRVVVASSSACFHCGLHVPQGAHYPIQYENQTQQTCCAGCQAVAQTIIDSGQGAYYVHRTALPVRRSRSRPSLRNWAWMWRPRAMCTTCRKFSKALCGWKTNTSA